MKRLFSPFTLRLYVKVSLQVNYMPVTPAWGSRAAHPHEALELQLLQGREQPTKHKY
ncbi:hypothetical protein EYF80_065235 [Liparis tanakae]|uniref:Uncharacterized protein n=1 Tax=Liparis tanakae TaxID=230148 RepID=A0A4Z2E791_9TELE|nr:hypothetical protein EYF80_065235 [Liparis tanakae]